MNSPQIWYNKGEVTAGAEGMVYVRALWNWLRTEKTKRDLLDCVRAAVVIAAVMAMVRIVLDMINML